MSDYEKAMILDWLVSPVKFRSDRPAIIETMIKKNNLQYLLEFRAWCKPKEALEALKQAMIESDEKNERDYSWLYE
jgi:hypothetical protein